jgi:hypothetical protein
MYINSKRIRNVEKYLIGLKEGESFYVASADSQISKERARTIGFTNSLNDGEVVLPKIMGPISKFNAEGGFIKLKDEPKETCYRERLWEWTDWGGTSHSKVVYIPYQRYKRRIIPAPGEEVSLVNNTDVAVILSRKLTYSPSTQTEVKHVINLFLEIFGECQILRENLIPIVKAPTQRLNWNVLPPGRYPWEKAKEVVKNYTQNLSANKTAIIKNRLITITNHEPDFIAIGSAGFDGYWVLGFSKKNLYLLESLRFGNATYVLNQDWQAISQMTKAEIIAGELCEARIIHKEGWTVNINNLLK